MASYIRFVSAEPKPKTKVWDVVKNTDDEFKITLGEVSWFGRWRCYAFFPHLDTVFEKTCLRDIADFCEEQTKAHRKKAQ